MKKYKVGDSFPIDSIRQKPKRLKIKNQDWEEELQKFIKRQAELRTIKKEHEEKWKFIVVHVTMFSIFFLIFLILFFFPSS